MKVEKVNFTSDNLRLMGEVYIPGEDANRYAAVLMCHGISAGPYTPGDRSWPVLAEKFTKAGFVTMIFNFRGAGLSQGNFDILGWARDLKKALDFLLKIDAIDGRRIYILGSSAGASVGIYVAAHDSRIAGLVSLACPATFNFIRDNQPQAVLQHFREVGIIKDKNFPPSIEDWLDNFDSAAPIHWVDKISPRPLLLMHGDRDDVVPVEQAYQLYGMAHEPKEFVIIQGAGHRLRLVERAVDLALSWLKKQSVLIQQG